MTIIVESRKLLGDAAKGLTDEEVLKIRDAIQEMAVICVEHYFTQKKNKPKEDVTPQN